VKVSLDCETDKYGVVLARYLNGPMHYPCAEAAGELGALIEQWRSPEVKN